MTPIDVVLFCLAWNVYFEARGEPQAGQHAVAEVTLRRADLSGRTVCEEVFEDRQFSWTQQYSRPTVTNNKAWAKALEVANTTLLFPTNYSRGATHFHNKTVKPKWSRQLCHATTINQHVFYKPCPNT